MCAVHLRLIGQPIVDFLLVRIKHFCYVLQLRHYEQISIESQLFWRGWVNLAQNFRQQSSPTNHSSCQKTRCIDLTIWQKNGVKVSLIHAFDRQMDGRLLSQILCCIECSAVKKVAIDAAVPLESCPHYPASEVTTNSRREMCILFLILY